MTVEKLKDKVKGFAGPAKHLNRSVTKDALSKHEHLTVVFVLLENFSLAALSNAVDVLVTANLISATPMIEFSYCSLSTQTVRSDIGLEIQAEHSVEQIYATNYDMLIVCGGYRTPLKPHAGLNTLITQAANRQRWIGSLWNGVYHIANAGLLNDKSCTAHPDNTALLAELFPKTSVCHKPYVIDGHYFSSAGQNSAMPMMLEIIAHVFGREIKQGTEEILACDTHTDADDNVTTQYKHSTLPTPLRAIIELMENNIEEPLSLNEIASYVSLSRRQIERLFARYFNVSPSRFYLELRLTRGRQLLMQSNRSVAEISLACGFLTSTHFSHSFRAVFGLSPKQMRASAIRS